MTPKQFVSAVKKAKKISEYRIGGIKMDWERFHSLTDELMESLLIELGYEDGVEMIRKGTRWYA